MVFYAQEEAQKFGEGYVSTEHLLLGLVRESDSVAARVLERLGVSLSRIRAEVEKQLPKAPLYIVSAKSVLRSPRVAAVAQFLISWMARYPGGQLAIKSSLSS